MSCSRCSPCECGDLEKGAHDEGEKRRAFGVALVRIAQQGASGPHDVLLGEQKSTVSDAGHAPADSRQNLDGGLSSFPSFTTASSTIRNICRLFNLGDFFIRNHDSVEVRTDPTAKPSVRSVILDTCVFLIYTINM